SIQCSSEGQFLFFAARLPRKPRGMAEEQEEETEILEELEEETEDVEVASQDGSDAGGEGNNEVTVTQDEVMDKYKVVYDQALDRVKFPPDITAEVQRTWQLFLTHAG
ncbi:unnamed protein product, partial [Effrenium voratum]